MESLQINIINQIQSFFQLIIKHYIQYIGIVLLLNKNKVHIN
jgi:hypothetical protein